MRISDSVQRGRFESSLFVVKSAGAASNSNCDRMGKRQHQKDKMCVVARCVKYQHDEQNICRYLTCSEWTQFYGGKKVG